MDHFEHDQWNVICDRCGFKYKARQLKKEWTGLRVCSGGGTNDCFEVRNAQEKVRGVKDKQATPWTRPEQDDINLSTNEVRAEDL